MDIHAIIEGFGWIAATLSIVGLVSIAVGVITCRQRECNQCGKLYRDDNYICPDCRHGRELFGGDRTLPKREFRRR